MQSGGFTCRRVAWITSSLHLICLAVPDYLIRAVTQIDPCEGITTGHADYPPQGFQLLTN